MNKKIKFKKSLVSVMTVVFVLVAGILFLPNIVRSQIKIEEDRFYKVSRVIDGDTFEIKYLWQKATIRMLGVNTPETVDPRRPAECFGLEASKETKKILTDTFVTLKLSPNRESKDKYGRYLTYVYLKDGSLFNLYLIENGFAREYTFGKKYSLQGEFKASENEAKQRMVGLWGSCSK